MTNHNHIDLALEIFAESQESPEAHMQAHELAVFVEQFGQLITEACKAASVVDLRQRDS